MPGSLEVGEGAQALTNRSDMGVLSSSGRCCSKARTMQLAMMVAKIIYSKGVRGVKESFSLSLAHTCLVPGNGVASGIRAWLHHGCSCMFQRHLVPAAPEIFFLSPSWDPSGGSQSSGSPCLTCGGASLAL